MMKLLKYDLKRNTNMLIGIAAILLIVQLSIMLFIGINEVRLVLSIMAYFTAGIIVFVTMIKTYTYNIKAYQRRLLPVHTFHTVVSPIFLGMSCLLVLMIGAGTQGYIYSSKIPQLANLWEMVKMSWTDTSIVLLSGLWSIIYLVIMIFLAITIAYSIRMKGSFWFGIVAFLLVWNGLSWIESLIFNNQDTESFQVYSLQIDVTQNHIFTGTMIFEMICAVIFLYIIVKLLDRRVEV
ncbi:hypothetical protein [Paenibacillus sp. IHBB 10380]|uniref:hypothetical protein n=1 Tax=Paenibacillus sp. IHBB 10380 TaxID=1566358 RepID=UPI0005CFE214|nr:hypothetical protein [Paenibacillus sp. IHBB 10380]AJS57367.1 hypothetical protein UB51_01390 [Paenibacillus sp. IHBB 10380]